MIRYGINGFGRIGRLALRNTLIDPKRGQIVAINNPGVSLDYLCYLMKYDSAHGTLNIPITHDDKNLIVNGQTIRVHTELDPAKIPWKESGVETLLECTGKFLTTEKV